MPWHTHHLGLILLIKPQLLFGSPVLYKVVQPLSVVASGVDVQAINVSCVLREVAKVEQWPVLRIGHHDCRFPEMSIAREVGDDALRIEAVQHDVLHQLELDHLELVYLLGHIRSVSGCLGQSVAVLLKYLVKTKDQRCIVRVRDRHDQRIGIGNRTGLRRELAKWAQSERRCHQGQSIAAWKPSYEAENHPMKGWLLR